MEYFVETRKNCVEHEVTDCRAELRIHLRPRLARLPQQMGYVLYHPIWLLARHGHCSPLGKP